MHGGGGVLTTESKFTAGQQVLCGSALCLILEERDGRFYLEREGGFMHRWAAADELRPTSEAIAVRLRPDGTLGDTFKYDAAVPDWHANSRKLNPLLPVRA